MSTISITIDIVYLQKIEMQKACNYIPWILPFLKTISDENRLKIICVLKEWEKCVNHIVKITNLPQNLVSHHLKKLKEAEIVIATKEGLNVRYKINHKKVDEYLKEFDELFGLN